MQRARLRIVGVHCSTCILPVRRALEKAEGVKSVGANYVTDLIEKNPLMVKRLGKSAKGWRMQE